MSFYLGIIITLVIIFAMLSVFFDTIYREINNFSVSSDKLEINKNALPLIKDDKRYIELQTKEWIKKRNNGEPCYAVIEKDKIVMTKWMKMFNIDTSKIHFFGYHDQFTLNDLKKYCSGSTKPMVIKISHLQSSYGIIIVPPNPSEEKIQDIYLQCKEKFYTSFVCNHDKNDPPTNSEIEKGAKKSYYKLYETIKPGIIIQDFFYSKKEVMKKPKELKILLIGNRILFFGFNPWALYDFYKDKNRYKLLFEEAQKIRSLLGATFIRVDFFVKENDNPYIPYLNEISLSPNGGLSRAIFHSSKDIDKYKKEIMKTKIGEYNKLDKLIIDCPFRDLPIKRYLTDAENVLEKGI